MYAFPTQDWANAYKDALNQSATYKEAAKDWTHGSVSMIVKANPSIGIATEHMGCLKPLDGGPLKQASTIESLTPLMINLARLNQLKDLGINFS